LKVGGIAQLVERCLCKADASGSNPLISNLEIFVRNRNNQSEKNGQKNQGEWRRPRHLETMKGADTGETLRGAGNKL
jgi:hypothetical protein